jgi:hypothetical protein
VFDIVSAHIAKLLAPGIDRRLKKILAERDLEIEVMKEIAVKKW